MDSMEVKRSLLSYEGVKNIQAALRMLFMVVFIGWLMVWVMLPTNTYKLSWTPILKAKANSTYFGAQGTNLLLFTFPIMFIAAFSCAYLQLAKKSENNCNESRTGTISRLAFLTQPMFVKAPMGIVTMIELMFSIMFLALLIWSLANYLHVSFGHLRMHKEGEQVWKAKFRSVSLRLGYVGNICWAFMFFPVTRGSSILPLVGLTSESSIKYHIWLGHLSMILFTAHSIGFIIYWAMTDQMSLMLEWSKDWVSNVAGEIALVFALAMWATSFPRVRRKMFELFFYTHHLYILSLFFYVHVGIAYFCTILPGIFLFLIDRYLRFLQSWQRVRLVSACVLPCEAVELNFSKSPELNYTPTSIVFVNIPSISKLQWHPFTVTSNCNMEPDQLSIVIKCDGSWSQKLYHTLSLPSSMDHLDVSIEGPYGPISPHFLRHDSLVMVSGGSGITAVISIFREIVHRSAITDCQTQQLLLVCAFKNSTDLAMLDLLLPTISGIPSDVSRIKLKIMAFVTREKNPPLEDTRKLLQTIWFKTSSSDAPITSILGPNNWLWLGAIISSSFLMFLLFLGILTRYYIYPIDHNTDQIYHYSGRALWDMFFVCVCIFIVASMVFLWNKKQKSIEGKQVLNIDVRTPTTSPGTTFYNNADREVESVLRQSLVQATEVHFGARPDLKKILFDRKGSNVGVLVCGPQNMRHEVAKICSAGLVDNLHFEAISFNW